ncbi:MAG TPA: hypothetical protein VFB55_08860 [Verrucomicrobiae bacterium]|nr:hypothetical protein [Verrucomicrobiae bacterium]
MTGRRIRKAVHQWNGSGFSTNPVSVVRFVDDGGNLLAILRACLKNA